MGVALPYAMSTYSSIPGVKVCANPGIEIAKADELSDYEVDETSLCRSS